MMVFYYIYGSSAHILMFYINFVYLSNFIAKHKLSRLHICDAMMACRIFTIYDKDITNLPPPFVSISFDLRVANWLIGIPTQCAFEIALRKLLIPHVIQFNLLLYCVFNILPCYPAWGSI